MKKQGYYLVVMVLACFALTACQKDQASVDLGKEYGKLKTIEDCNNRAFEILAESELYDGYSTTPHDFAFGCSLTASRAKEYCTDVPVSSVFQSVKWKDDQCTDHNNPKACEEILKHAVGRCISDREINAQSSDVKKQSSKDVSPTI